MRPPTARCTIQFHQAQGRHRVDVIRAVHHTLEWLARLVSQAQVAVSPWERPLFPVAVYRLER